ncbi:MAG: ATP-binding protein [Bacteroidota bacterium]|nr:ATP-binding protein [Bacteroidota bacterium]
MFIQNMEREIKINSIPENLREVEKLIDEISVQYSLESDMYGKVLIASIEAVNNSIVHGNKSNPNKIVAIGVENNNEKLRILIKDEGAGFDYDHIPDPTAPENIENIHGRGVFLMNHLSDEVNFLDNGAGVELIFNIV